MIKWFRRKHKKPAVRTFNTGNPGYSPSPSESISIPYSPTIEPTPTPTPTAEVEICDNLVDLWIDGSSGNIEFEANFALILKEMHELGKRKQASYGPYNIANFGPRGVIVRINDKFQRLIRLVWDGRRNPIHDETVQDTWMDLANYAVYGLMLERGLWPEQKEV